MADALTVPAPGSVSYLRSVSRQLTWRKLLVAQLLAIALGTYNTVSNALEMGFYFRAMVQMTMSGLLIGEIGINSVLVATLCAHEAVRRGANGWWVYPVALLSAAVLAGFLQWPARDALHMRVGMDDYDPNHPLRRYGHMVVVASQLLLTGACYLLVFTSRAREIECIMLTREAQLRRARIERALSQAELITLQTRLDPEQIHRDLQRLRDLYAQQSPAAESELDAFVLTLRQRTRRATPIANVLGDNS